MQTKVGRWTLVIFIVLSVVFAVCGWLMPYDWRPDPQVKAEIVGVELRRDHSYYWLTVHVRARGGESLDLTQPARLVVRREGDLQPADTRLAGSPESGFREAWFKFWLEADEVSGPLKLGLPDGSLSVKSTGKDPALKHGKTRNFTTHRW